MSCLARTVCIAALACTALAAATAAGQPAAPPSNLPTVQDSEELNIAVGEQHSLSASSVKSFSEGVRGIADIRLTPDNSQFVIVGQKPGSTTLLLIRDDGTESNVTINVFARSLPAVEREVRQLLEGAEGVRMRRVGGRFFLEGQVASEEDLRRTERIAALFPGQVESLLVLAGSKANTLNIRIDFFFVQYDKSKTYQFGVSWPSSVGGAGIATVSADYDFLANATTSAQAAVVDQPLPGLDIAATRGWAKVLKHSTVITSNGTEATFSNGGEQNYAVSTGFSAALQQIQFGTDVTVLPRFDPETQRLDVKVVAQVADLTPPIAGGTTLPGRNLSKLSTQAVLKLGESIVLSGIRARSQRHSTGGLPLLSNIPLVGVLFGTHSDVQAEVEGAIYVVPSIIDSIPKGVQTTLDEALRDYEAYDGDLEDVAPWQEVPTPRKRSKPRKESQLEDQP